MPEFNATPSLAALERTNWRVRLAGNQDFVELWGTFNELAQTSADLEDLEAASACAVLAGVSSLIPDEEQMHEPYLAMIRMGGRRSFLPDDLSELDLQFLADLLSDLPDNKLAARVGDMLWIRRFGSSPYQFARTAVDRWIQLPVDADSWYGDGRENWPRYLLLARQLRLSDKLDVARGRLEEAFEIADGSMAMDLANLLAKCGVDDDVDRRRIASRLAQLAQSDERPIIARDLHRAAAHWYSSIQDSESASRQLLAVVQSWISEAEQRAGDSAAVANSLYESALQDYRMISVSERRRLNVSDLGNDLVSRIRSSGITMLDQMSSFTSEAIDLTAEAAAVQDHIAGQAVVDATARFVSLVPYLSEQDERAAAERQLSDSAILGLLPVRHLANDGRIVHTSGPDEPGPWGYPSDVWNAMLQRYEIHLQYYTKGRILPALEVLANEHRLRIRDFLAVAEGSAIVPPDRSRTVARALAAGFNYDFTAALYMLVPQLENIIRHVLQDCGLSTVTISEGVHQEIGLSSLLERPQLIEVLGADHVYEMRALFGGPTGANLRNEVAHGLLSDGGASSVNSAYAWWFFLRLIYTPYWNRLHPETD
ncbi:DUF4209 domain-containing protein [Rathayibacter sp. VKM Ac-2754]|uniref:DUF4209 domain-containing protein n=1 Tax=Rathayibacter sp. VKM Ac-2754 TaxID=2609251 RepID=UPI00135B1961|nr:DUF4209 domain-containing protein [Rathayibacter sp. VKM Ac-2754]MWV57772.1 DUF4209 domain-containing protein [Rathayibacter sp. VKM Ac-2754]